MRQIAIPQYYVWVAKNSQAPKSTYQKLVSAYLKHNYPNYDLVDIHQTTALIERRDETHEASHSKTPSSIDMGETKS